MYSILYQRQRLANLLKCNVLEHISDMGQPDLNITHDLRNYPVMLNIPHVLLNLLPGLGRKDVRW